MALACLCLYGCATSGEAELREQIERQTAADDAARRQHKADADQEIRSLLAAKEKARAKEQQEFDKRFAASAPPAPISDPVEDWLRQAEQRCAFEMNYKACDAPPPSATGSERSCHDRCTVSLKAFAEKLVSDAMDNCLNAYRAEAVPSGPGPECALSIPATADPAGNGEGLSEAARVKLRVTCTEACREEGAQLLLRAKESERAAQQGQQLVLSYKRCMLAVDGTREAIRYRIHDTDLYQDLMQKTDSRCRAASRCDWLEKYSDEFSCSYGN